MILVSFKKLAKVFAYIIREKKQEREKPETFLVCSVIFFSFL